MLPTALVYSSHNRCNYIHNDWIVQRALNGNRHVLFLPISAADQDYSWGTFRWFFEQYKPYGLLAIPFFWSEGLRRQDADLLGHWTSTAEVVVLGGGNPARGRNRYRAIGESYYGDPDWYGKLLHHRQARGLLSVGFSAGVDQLCEYGASGDAPEEEDRGWGLCRNVIAFSHFEHGAMEDRAQAVAERAGHCLVFALPNDSGIASQQGRTPGGNVWQFLHFITDNSWDLPRDAFHIKTRMGVKIQHWYCDGRHWAFNGGDSMLRIQSPDGGFNEAFLVPPGGPIIDYWTHQVTGYENFQEIIESH